VLHLERSAVGAVGAEAQVDLQRGRRVADEPAGLERDGAAGRGPICAVCGEGDAAAWRCWEEGTMLAAVFVCFILSLHRGGEAILFCLERRVCLQGYIHCMP
jgi:hypothetical protein